MRLTSSLVLLLPLALLGACGQEPAPAEVDGRSASGEVLEGTISDAMLPLATVRSQPPLLDPEEGTEGTRPRSRGSAAATDAPAPGAAEEPAEPPAAPADQGA